MRRSIEPMKPKLLLLDEPCDKAKEILREIFDLHFDNMFECDAIWTGLTPIEHDVVFCPCTGIEHIKANEVIYLDEEWKSGEGRQVTSTAEHTWSLILQLAKMKRMQLSGKTIGCIGCGRIGSQVFEYAKAFEMRWISYDVKYHNYNYLEKVLTESDIITIHVPLNDATRGMIGRKEFQKMKPGAMLINTSRAYIVDYEALMGYENKVYYADDFGDSRVLCRRNTIQTNHVGGNSIEAREATDIYVAQKAVEHWRSKNP